MNPGRASGFLARLFCISLFALVPLAGAQAAFEACADYFPQGQPPALQLPGLQVRDICFDSFAVLHSGKTKTPVYAVEKLNRERLLAARDEQRTNRFYEEARLPRRERARLEDYKDSGYDRGHMAPAGDMPNPDAMAQSFSLANVVPQVQSHNRKTWNRIERDTRRYAMRAKGDVYVFTGPWFSGPPTLIGSGVWVPEYLWKLVYDPATGRAWVHWSRNSSGQPVLPPIGYDEFVRRTGLRLLPETAAVRP
ncbi:MAG: endonuclease [Rhodocyclaceae bacterium]|nr:endonuclease [Rhodocyclaceae bacterium]